MAVHGSDGNGGYGLRLNEWLDERGDPEKATLAALTYLDELYSWFNDWSLALAGYTRGEFGMSGDMVRNRIAEFFDLANSRSINGETKDFVPQIYAAILISREPEKYGFVIPDPVVASADTIAIDYMVDLAVAAKAVGKTEDDLKALNPELRRWVTPKISDEYPAFSLKLPPGTKDEYVENISIVEDKTPVGRDKYIVKKGDTLDRIGRKFGVGYKSIMAWNDLKTTVIRPGQALYIRKK
ncbi:MAG: LysM peptidoglycan-binding domain-containing protein [Nanoarchaeota archaeon]